MASPSQRKLTDEQIRGIFLDTRTAPEISAGLAACGTHVTEGQIRKIWARIAHPRVTADLSAPVRSRGHRRPGRRGRKNPNMARPGEQCGAAKLTWAIVNAVRRTHAKRCFVWLSRDAREYVERRYGIRVSRSAMQDVLASRTWNSAPGLDAKAKKR